MGDRTGPPVRHRPPSPPYPAGLECDVTTTLGTELHVRAIRPDDAPRLAAFHLGLTPRSVYRRFFSIHPRLSETELERFTCVDYVDRLALIAEIGDRLVAVARYDRLPGTSDAEVAFVVADDLQHHGISTLLFELLAEAARGSGITAFVASTLAENREMLGIFTGSGFDVSTRLDCGVVEVRFLIDPDSRGDGHTPRRATAVSPGARGRSAVGAGESSAILAKEDL
jgi:GNAT superfamily N-acetyltransferase